MTGAGLPLVELDPEIDPWERQSGRETPYRFSQFCLYRDGGRGRTLRKVAETLARNDRYIRAVSAAYRWVERAEAWDRHRDQLHERVWLEERRKASENDAKLLSVVVGKVAQRLNTLKAEDLEPSDLIRMLDVVMRHRRGLFGDPAATIALTGAGGDPLTVQLAEFAQLPADQRRAAIVQLTDAVRRRTEAAAGISDDDE